MMFSKRKRKHVLCVSVLLVINTCESLGELKKAVKNTWVVWQVPSYPPGPLIQNGRQQKFEKK